MIQSYESIEVRKETSILWRKGKELTFKEIKIAWRVEVPEETDKKIKSFIGTLKAAAKAAEEMGREPKEVTRDFPKREIYYKGTVLCRQDEWTGDFTWVEKEEIKSKTMTIYAQEEKERVKNKKK